MALGGPSVPSTKVLLWNLQLSQLTGNPLEFLPSKGALSPAVQATLAQLLQRVDQLMLRPESSPRLGELLGNRPLTQAAAPEKTPIAKVPHGLHRWLESRQAEWADLWPGLDLRSVAELWCRDHSARWAFWQRQTLHEWLCDDGSGAKANPWLPTRKPAVSEVCPDLGLAAADLAYGSPPARCSRAKWMRHARKAGVPFSAGVKLPGPARHDLFKLLVWDLILDSVLSRLPDAHVAALFRELRTAHSELRMRRVAACTSTADVAILLGAPGSQALGLDGCWLVRSQVADDDNSIVIAARRDLFREPILENLPGDGGVPDPHVVACTLIRQDQGSRLTVIGVRTPSSKREARHLAERLEALLQPSTILGIDFGEDVRSSHIWWDVAASLPKLGMLLEQARNLPAGFGTTNKQRSPFQPQISKMFLHDFEMRDLLFVGDRFEQPLPQGLLERSRCLPDLEVPSDHAPLTVQLRPRGSGHWEAAARPERPAAPSPLDADASEVPPSPLLEDSRLPPEVQAAFLQPRREPSAVATSKAEERPRKELEARASPPSKNRQVRAWSPPSLTSTWQPAAAAQEEAVSAEVQERRGPAPAEHVEKLPFTRLAVEGRPDHPVALAGSSCGAGVAPLGRPTEVGAAEELVSEAGLSTLSGSFRFCSSLDTCVQNGNAGPSAGSASSCESPPLLGGRLLLGEQETDGASHCMNLEKRVDMLHGMFRNREALLMEEQITTAKLRSELENVQGELRRRREEEERLREQVQSLQGRLSEMRQGGQGAEVQDETDEATVKSEETPAAEEEGLEVVGVSGEIEAPSALDLDASRTTLDTQSVSDATTSVEMEAELAALSNGGAEEDASGWAAEGWTEDGGEWTWQEDGEWNGYEYGEWGEEWAGDEAEYWAEADPAAQTACADEQEQQPSSPSRKADGPKKVSWGDVETAEVPAAEVAGPKKVSWGEVETEELPSLEAEDEPLELPARKASFRESEIYKELEQSLSEHLRPEDREGMLVEEADDGELEAVVTPPEALLALLLPESEDSFVESCREVAEGAHLALLSATQFHMGAIASQLDAATHASRSGHQELRESIRGSVAQDDAEMEQQDLLAEVGARTSELKVLAQDLPMHEHFTAEERQEIAAHLDAWTKLCENELRLLRMPTALGDVPESFVGLLVEIGNSPRASVPDEQWDAGLSPVHWAAQHCRRDLIEYFCRHSSWKSLLDAYDEKGRTPLYYAQGPRGMALIAWLRSEVGALAPIHQASSRPTELSTLPERIKGLLDQIEVHGWRSAKWASNFTMLHWAASHGDKALCRYCMHLGADLHAQDWRMRTPLDCASEAGQRPMMNTLGDLMRRPTELTVCLSAFRCTRELRRKVAKRCTVGHIDLSAFDSGESKKVQNRGSLPETYLRIWEQSEEIGWEKMEWVNGYTLLHWAAKNDLTELCARLLSQKADPKQQDADGKDAFDYAMEASSNAALERLRLGAPSRLPPVMMTPITKEARESREVKVTPELLALQASNQDAEEAPEEWDDEEEEEGAASEQMSESSCEEIDLTAAEASHSTPS